MAPIAHLVGLEHLSITDCSRGFDALAVLHQLHTLALHRIPTSAMACGMWLACISNSSVFTSHNSMMHLLAHLQGLPLQAIDIFDVKELKSLTHLPLLPNLTSLNCVFCSKLTDTGLSGISAKAPNLKSLILILSRMQAWSILLVSPS